MNTTIKVLSSIVILLLLVLGMGIFGYRTLSTTSKNLEDKIARVEASAKDGKWEQAGTEISKIEEDWSKTEKTWAILLDHIEIDNIDTTLSRMKNFVDQKEKSLALAEAATLRLYVKHIPQKEAFNLKNIL